VGGLEAKGETSAPLLQIFGWRDDTIWIQREDWERKKASQYHIARNED